VDWDSLEVRNVEIGKHFTNTAHRRNFGIVPLMCADDRIWVADNVARKVLVFDADGALQQRLDVGHVVGGMAFLDGALYVTLPERHTVERYSEEVGGFVVVSGVRGRAGHRDGVGLGALLNHPTGIAAGVDDALYVADTFNGVVRRVSPDGRVRTLCGFASGEADGKAADAAFLMPVTVAVRRDGAVAVGDIATGRIALVGGAPAEVGPLPRRTVDRGPAETKAILARAPFGERLHRALCRRGRWLAEHGSPGEAIADFKRAVTIMPYSLGPRLLAAEVHRKAGRLKEAEATLDEAIAMKERLPLSERSADADYIAALYRRALMRRADGRLKQAMADVEKAITARTHRVNSLRMADLPEATVMGILGLRGRILLAQKKYKSALEVFTAVIKASGGEFDAYLLRARARMHLEQYHEALKDLRKAVVMEEGNPEPHYWLGVLYQDKFNEPRKALDCLRTHKTLKGGHVDDCDERIRRLEELLKSGSKRTGSYTETRVEDDKGRVWIIRRYVDGRVERIPVEEK